MLVQQQRTQIDWRSPAACRLRGFSLARAADHSEDGGGGLVAAAMAQGYLLRDSIIPANAGTDPP
jgi:hypothetical protein